MVNVVMKSIINGVKLTIESKKNCLPIGKGIFGFLKLRSDLAVAEFHEETLSGLFERKSIRLKRGRGYSVSFNPENNTYRITLSVHADDPDWFLLADDNFECCMNYIGKRVES